MSNGTKFDHGKNRLDLLLDGFVYEVGEVLTHGSIVHGDYNWMDVDQARNRYRAALRRHEMKSRDEVYDVEMKLSHLACVATNAMFLWHFEARRNVNDILPCVCQRCFDGRYKPKTDSTTT